MLDEAGSQLGKKIRRRIPSRNANPARRRSISKVSKTFIKFDGDKQCCPTRIVTGLILFCYFSHRAPIQFSHVPFESFLERVYGMGADL